MSTGTLARPVPKISIVLASALACALAAGCGGGDKPSEKPRATGGGTPATTASQQPARRLSGSRTVRRGGLRVTVSGAGQHDLLARRPLVVRIGSKRGLRGIVSIGVGRGAGAERRVSVPRGGSRRVLVRLPAGAERALGGCAARRVVAAVSTGRGAALRVPVPVRLEPPRCGRFFTPDGFWNAALPDDIPIDPRSKKLVAELRSQVDEAVGKNFGPSVNISRFSAPVYTVPRDQRRVRVTLDRSESFADPLRKAFAKVPLPQDAKPAEGDDGHLVVWQPSTDTMWEFFKLERRSDGWHARFGGRIEQASANDGIVKPVNGVQFGATATSLPLAGGLLTEEELRRGRIDHALALALPRTRSGIFAAPAQRTDGNVSGDDKIPEGARFRLDPSLDIGKLDLPPLTRMMAEAAQRYGIYVRDKSGTVTFYAEDPATFDGKSPFPALLGDRTTTEALRPFPWNRLQVVRMRLKKFGGEKQPDNPGPEPDPDDPPTCRIVPLACP